MAPHTVPPEVAHRIARLVDRRTLTVLARTSRTLQTAAEKRIYETLEFFHHPVAFAVCDALGACPRLAAYVRNFVLTAGPSHRSRDREREQQIQYVIRQTVQSPEYWAAVHRALANFRTLEYLYIVDPTFENAWILAPTENWVLRASEARLYFPWDESVAAFLETQDRLRMLTITDVAENIPLAPLSVSSLPNLTHFEGPLMLVDQLLHCPITHLKCPIDTEDAVSLLPLVLPELSQFKKLRSLSVVAIPQEMVLQSVAAISLACPRLKHLSHIPLPMEHKQRLKVLQHLSRLSEITTVELDIAHWNPQLVSALQRVFAVELRMVLPRLKNVYFWNRLDRWSWTWTPEAAEPVRGHVFADARESCAADGAGLGAGAAAAPAAAAAAATWDENYIGLEGWKPSWVHTHYALQSQTWKNDV